MAPARALARLALCAVAALSLACGARGYAWPWRRGGLASPDGGRFVDTTARVAPAGLGSVAAVADLNRDRFLDVVALDGGLATARVSLWDRDAARFAPAPAPAVSLAAARGGPRPCPLKRIASVVPGDFNGDGAVDLLLADGAAACVFYAVGNGTFHRAVATVLPELPADFVVMDANADLELDVFMAFANGTRAFYVFHPPDDPAAVLPVVELKPWDDSVSAECQDRGSSARPAAPAFVDIDGDCLPDLVIPTVCGLEVWSSGAAEGTPFWDMRASAGDSRYRLLATDVYNAAHGDSHLVFADLDMDGTIDIGVGNRNRGDLLTFLNKQRVRPHGELCTRDPDWKLSRRVGVASGLDLKPASIGPLFGRIDVPASIHVGDYDFDGLPDLLVTKRGAPVLYRNLGKWSAKDESIDAHFASGEDESTLATATGRGTAISAFFFDTGEAGRQDIMVVMSGNKTSHVRNSFVSKTDSLFFKGTALSGLPFRSSPRPFAPVTGSTFKVAYMSRNARHRVTRTCSQCPQSTAWTLQSCNCMFGLLEISNYIEEIGVGAGAHTRSWTNLMPNSMAVVWAESEKGSSSWWMEFFTQRRGGQMLRVVSVLTVALIALTAGITYLQVKERKEDRESISEQQVQLFNFGGAS